MVALEKDKTNEPIEQGNPMNDAIPDTHNGSQNTQSSRIRTTCEVCRLFNHATKDCRRLFCDICGLHNHVTYDCKRCVPWNTDIELCSAQVEDQSFFFIEECIDPRVARVDKQLANKLRLNS
jgi:hypothetical protein